jgi:hypothetical protein
MRLYEAVMRRAAARWYRSGVSRAFSCYLLRIRDRKSAVYPKIPCNTPFTKHKFCKVVEKRGCWGEKIRSGVVVNVRG